MRNKVYKGNIYNLQWVEIRRRRCRHWAEREDIFIPLLTRHLMIKRCWPISVMLKDWTVHLWINVVVVNGVCSSLRVVWVGPTVPCQKPALDVSTREHFLLCEAGFRPVRWSRWTRRRIRWNELRPAASCVAALTRLIPCRGERDHVRSRLAGLLWRHAAILSLLLLLLMMMRWRHCQRFLTPLLYFPDNVIDDSNGDTLLFVVGRRWFGGVSTSGCCQSSTVIGGSSTLVPRPFSHSNN